jgi:hypothetical protein
MAQLKHLIKEENKRLINLLVMHVTEGNMEQERAFHILNDTWNRSSYADNKTIKKSWNSALKTALKIG